MGAELTPGGQATISPPLPEAPPLPPFPALPPVPPPPAIPAPPPVARPVVPPFDPAVDRGPSVPPPPRSPPLPLVESSAPLSVGDPEQATINKTGEMYHRMSHGYVFGRSP